MANTASNQPVQQHLSNINELPVLPLRDVVVYPHMVIPLFVGREKSVRALDMAMEGDKRILLVAQRSPDTDDPQSGDLYSIGTVATVLQLLKLPDGTIKVLVEGVMRAEVSSFSERDGIMTGYARALESVYTREPREVVSGGGAWCDWAIDCRLTSRRRYLANEYAARVGVRLARDP